MVEFLDSERTYLNETRAITMDVSGQEVLVGLTAEETEVYMDYLRNNDLSQQEHYLKLHNKHERARLEVIHTEVYLRNENPARH